MLITKGLSLITLYFLLCMGGMVHGAQEVPALREAKDPNQRARIQRLINGALAENKLEWVGVQIEPGQAKYILEKFKIHYGLTNLVTEYTFSNTAQLITSIEQLLKSKKITLTSFGTQAGTGTKT